MQQEELCPTIISLVQPSHQYSLLLAGNGELLGLQENGELAQFMDAGDHVIWDFLGDEIKHVVTGKVFARQIKNNHFLFTVGGKKLGFERSQGPERLPSEYLEELRKEGWTCLNSILSQTIIEGLERVACTGPYEDQEPNSESPKICQHAAVGASIAEPISLWVLREYLESRDIHLGHPPGFNVLPPEQIAKAGRSWHSDIPYTKSTSPQPVFPRIGPPKACNRNTFVTDFSYKNGATMLKPGSHLLDSAPPESWNAPLVNDELPYSGPEATVVEAPSGSLFLYDARTWHRAGYNRSDRKRGMMATNYETPDVLPKRDTRPACNKLHNSSVYSEMTLREQREVTNLLMKVPDYKNS
ncbi:MAG: phytanoyl-CoA dioxygenase family protein [Candidatus Azotimanducaceae bacterium]|uniref:Phytanoyl-CoA dioxygenase n=1 Tax=OM182 bacterium TaxID=2510334 RepID=A0A520RXZ7_9GAMM|nr:hypothetical protein [Gammaproteobacteria bacterium]RZO75071.1 MAG: hypothetical protein EVA68_07835 [OM182 bacterium]